MSTEIDGVKLNNVGGNEGFISKYFKVWMDKINKLHNSENTITLKTSPAWDCRYSIVEIISMAKRCMIHRHYHERGSGVSTGYATDNTEGNRVISVKITDDENDLWLLLGISDEGWVYVADNRPDNENPDWEEIDILPGVLEVNGQLVEH